MRVLTRPLPLDWLDVMIVAVNYGRPTGAGFFLLAVGNHLMVITSAKESAVEKGVEAFLLIPDVSTSRISTPILDDCRLHDGKACTEEAYVAVKVSVAWLYDCHSFVVTPGDAGRFGKTFAVISEPDDESVRP